ncbi:ABC superfamily ATP binding cassette transporter, membrane protein [Companilactobacillus bobalius DSM 19674]|nr:ABC superfamily ATP binding cassette transporter, membrane protein [Companilactobacillus bobalius DSM 19674]
MKKFWYQKKPLWGVLILFILMYYSLITGHHNERDVIQLFGAGQWTLIILVTISSAFMSMEYRDNTIVTMLYKSSNRFNIYFSKIIVLVLYSVLLSFCGAMFTILEVAFSQQLLTVNVLRTLLFNVFGTFLYSIFIVTLSLLLISLVKIDAIVIVAGLMLGFLGATFSNILMSLFHNWSELIRWNPLNMIYIVNQLSDSKYFKYTSLTNVELVLGTVSYAMIFLIIGYWAFKKRRV